MVGFSKCAPLSSAAVSSNSVHVFSVTYLSINARDFIRLFLSLLDVIVSVEQVDDIWWCAGCSVVFVGMT